MQFQVVSGQKFTIKGIALVCNVFQFWKNMLPSSGNIRDQSLKLFKIHRNSACFWPQFFFALQISEHFSSKTRTPTHWIPSSKQILTQNDHSRLFKVICLFRLRWRGTIRGYIVQYNNCGLECESSEDIGLASERNENRHFLRPHSLIWRPLSSKPPQISK